MSTPTLITFEAKKQRLPLVFRVGKFATIFYEKARGQSNSCTQSHWCSVHYKNLASFCDLGSVQSGPCWGVGRWAHGWAVWVRLGEFGPLLGPGTWPHVPPKPRAVLQLLQLQR